jgi:F-type H+-transporting ATPase subunit a
MLEHPVLLSTLLGIGEDYKHVFYTWLALIILICVGLLLRGKMKLVPKGLQNVAEVLIGGLEEFTVTTVGEKGRTVFPLLCGIFLFILVQNLLGLIPGCDAPTANVNTNAAMALFVFCYYNFVGLRKWGPGYIKHFMGPMPFLAPLMLPIELISHVSRPLSLTLRLFGNIRGEEIVLLLFFSMAPIAATFPTYFLFLLAKVLQAFIFYMLTMIYLQGAMEHAH